MEAKELRIGNCINYEQTTHIIQGINRATIQSYWIKDEEEKQLYGTHLSHIKPIPLTEEWLLKFGYELMPSKTYLAPNSGNFIWFENGLIDCSICGEYYMKHIKYVHQLQNLYFSLTGEELTIKYNE